MKDRLRNLFASDIIGSGLTLAISTFVKLGSGFLIAKLIALSYGIAGFGLISQLQSVLNIVLVFAGGGIVNGVVKYTSEFRSQENESMLTALMQKALKVAFFFGLICCLALLVFSKKMSLFLFQDDSFYVIIICIAIAQIFIGFNNVIQAFINGSRFVHKFAKASILGTLSGLVFFYFLASTSDIKLVMVGQIGFGLFSGMFFFFLCRKELDRINLFKKAAFNFSLRKLGKYSLMLIVTVLTLPMAHILIRNKLEGIYGWESVGKWQGVMKISDAYLQFITIVLTNYFFPKVAAMSDKFKIKTEVYRTLLTVIPITILAALVIYIYRYQIIIILYSESFLGISDFFFCQLVGDILKVAAYTIAYVLVAKGIFVGYLMGEIFQATCFVLVCNYCVGAFGQIGVIYGYALTYFIYLLFTISMLKIYVNTDLLKEAS